MLGYIKKYLQWLKYLVVQKVEDLAVSFSKPDFGAKLQRADNASTEEILKPSDIKPVQLVVVTLFYYALAVDNTMIVVLGDLVSTQTKVQLQNWRHWHSFWIMPLRILMHKFSAMQVKWSYISIVMDHTCQYQKLEANQEGKCLYRSMYRPRKNET